MSDVQESFFNPRFKCLKCDTEVGVSVDGCITCRANKHQSIIVITKTTDGVTGKVTNIHKDVEWVQ